MNTQSYKCRRLADNLPNHQLTEIGDFSWRFPNGGTEPGGMAIVLPNKDGKPEHDWKPVVRGAQLNDDMTYGWDGNLDQPTLEPSILLEGHWHGYLRAGRLESC